MATTLRRAAACATRFWPPSLPIAVITQPPKHCTCPRVCQYCSSPSTRPPPFESNQRCRRACSCRLCIVGCAATCTDRLQGWIYCPIAQKSPACRRVDVPGHTGLLQAQAAAHAGVSLDDMPVRMMLSTMNCVPCWSVSMYRYATWPLPPSRWRMCWKPCTSPTKLCSAAGPCATHRRGRFESAMRSEGLFGREENLTPSPQPLRWRAQGVDAHGPLPRTRFLCAHASFNTHGEFSVVV